MPTQRHHETQGTRVEIDPTLFDLSAELKNAIQRLTGLSPELIAEVQKELREVDTIARTKTENGPTGQREQFRLAASRQKRIVEKVQPLVDPGITVGGWRDLNYTLKLSPQQQERSDVVLAGAQEAGDKRDKIITLATDRIDLALPEMGAQVILQDTPEGRTILSSIETKKGTLVAPQVSFDYYGGSVENVVSLRNSDRADGGEVPDFSSFNGSKELGTWARYDMMGKLLTINVQFGRKPNRFLQRFQVTENDLIPNRPMTPEEEQLWKSAQVSRNEKTITITCNGREHTYPLTLSLPDLVTEVKKKIQGLQTW